MGVLVRSLDAIFELQSPNLGLTLWKLLCLRQQRSFEPIKRATSTTETPSGFCEHQAGVGEANEGLLLKVQVNSGATSLARF